MSQMLIVHVPMSRSIQEGSPDLVGAQLVRALFVTSIQLGVRENGYGHGRPGYLKNMFIAANARPGAGHKTTSNTTQTRARNRFARSLLGINEPSDLGG